MSKKRRSKRPISLRRNTLKGHVTSLSTRLRELSGDMVPGYKSDTLYPEERSVLFTAAINLESLLDNWESKPDYKMSDFV